MGKLGRVRLLRSPHLQEDGLHHVAELGAQPEHDDVVVEVDGPEVKLLPDLSDLSMGESETFLELAFAIVFANGVLVALLEVPHSYSSEHSFLENTILYSLLDIESSNALQVQVEMLSHAD